MPRRRHRGRPPIRGGDQASHRTASPQRSIDASPDLPLRNLNRMTQRDRVQVHGGSEAAWEDPDAVASGPQADHLVSAGPACRGEAADAEIGGRRAHRSCLDARARHRPSVARGRDPACHHASVRQPQRDLPGRTTRPYRNRALVDLLGEVAAVAVGGDDRVTPRSEAGDDVGPGAADDWKPPGCPVWRLTAVTQSKSIAWPVVLVTVPAIAPPRPTTASIPATLVPALTPTSPLSPRLAAP